MLTHGALLSLEAWALLWQPLLAAGHQVIAYDLRGHGHSTLGRSGFGVRAYAQDPAAVPDQLWALVEPLLPAPPRPPYGGRHRTIADRNCFAAIVFMARG